MSETKQSGDGLPLFLHQSSLNDSHHRSSQRLVVFCFQKKQKVKTGRHKNRVTLRLNKRFSKEAQKLLLLCY